LSYGIHSVPATLTIDNPASGAIAPDLTAASIPSMLKILALREAIQSGDYHVSALALSDAILRSLRRIN
jgi:hypothetical protein